MNGQPTKKVLVGMSGGVDSSASAALLKEQGYDVTGVFIKVWQADFLPCNWREERRDAMRAAAQLDIPFLTLDLEKEYKNDVIDYMIREYRAGRVPNPDVMCNKHVKFGAFLKYALSHGADYIATGHYARIEKNTRAALKSNSQGLPLYSFRLLAGADNEKDQSYFLWTLTEKLLAHALFPVGDMKKSDVRMLAKKYGLENADKRDSQGLCFMGKIDMVEFLQHYLKTTSGDVLDEFGEIIGEHAGAILYTIGQRHGFTTRKNAPDEMPYFVVGKDITKNTITVAHKFRDRIVGSTEVGLTDLNDISGSMFSSTKKLTARIRHRGELHPVKRISSLKAGARVEFMRPVSSISAGQSLVLYQGNECLGGGIIA
jgi:tRNA-uridine 2-sulfurtransferase